MWTKEDAGYLIVVNLSDFPAQAKVKVTWPALSGADCTLFDLFSGETYLRDGDEMLKSGLHVELGAWKSHFFGCKRAT
jgi:hypothetical protein